MRLGERALVAAIVLAVLSIFGGLFLPAPSPTATPDFSSKATKDSSTGTSRNRETQGSKINQNQEGNDLKRSSELGRNDYTVLELLPHDSTAFTYSLVDVLICV